MRYEADGFDVLEHLGGESRVVFAGCDEESARVVASALNGLVARRKALLKLAA